MYSALPRVFDLLSISQNENIRYIEDRRQIVLSPIEFFFFTFFCKISRMSKKDDGSLLSLFWNSKSSYQNVMIKEIAFEMGSDRAFINDQLIQHYELYLFSKYYLYAFEKARSGYSYLLELITSLTIEYLMSPVTLVNIINKDIDDMYSRSTRDMKYESISGSTGGQFAPNKQKFLKVQEEPQTTHMMFINVACIIMKDNWRSFLRHLIYEKGLNLNQHIGILFFKNVYKWFKTLLIECPKLVDGKLFYLGSIYLSIISPYNLEESNLFEHFEVKSKTFKDSLFEKFNISNTYSKKSTRKDQIFEKNLKGGKMDQESYSSWIKTFLVLYTDTLRDFVTYIADENLTGLDYLFIIELSDLY